MCRAARMQVLQQLHRSLTGLGAGALLTDCATLSLDRVPGQSACSGGNILSILARLVSHITVLHGESLEASCHAAPDAALGAAAAPAGATTENQWAHADASPRRLLQTLLALHADIVAPSLIYVAHDRIHPAAPSEQALASERGSPDTRGAVVALAAFFSVALAASHWTLLADARAETERASEPPSSDMPPCEVIPLSSAAQACLVDATDVLDLALHLVSHGLLRHAVRCDRLVTAVLWAQGGLLPLANQPCTAPSAPTSESVCCAACTSAGPRQTISKLQLRW